MRAVVVAEPGRLEVRDVPEPVADGRAIVAVEQGGICGTDLKILQGGRPITYPRTLGHETVGTVVSRASGGSVAVGTRVLVDPSVSCGRCHACVAGNTHLCPSGGLLGRDLDGGFAEFVAVADTQLIELPDSMAVGDASLLQVLGTCIHAQTRIDVFPGQTAVVIGLGVTGMLHLQLLRLRGVERVIGVTRSAAKRTLATELGAYAVASPDDADDVVASVTGGRGADVVVECVGQVETLAQAVEFAGRAGQVLAYGTISATSGDLPFYQLYLKELTVQLSRAARPDDYRRAVTLVAGSGLELARLVSRRYPIEQAEEAFTALSTEVGLLKVALDVAGPTDRAAAG